MSIISARKSPFPYHLKIGGTGLLLGSPGPNKPMLVSSKTQDIAQVNPPDFSYAGMSPLGDRDEPYESLALGMGLRTQEKWQDFRYASAQAVDLSVWPWCKGPQINMVTPSVRDTTQFYRSFFEIGGNLFCAQGRYILRRDSDVTWTMVKDFGASAAVYDTIVFTSNFDGVPRVWAALSTGLAQYSTDGVTWIPMVTFGSLGFAVIGREFWWADDVNRLRKCDTNADPRVEANYTSLIFRVGDKSAAITALMVTAMGTLVVSKTDGMYTLDQAGDDHQLFPFLKFAHIGDNGRHWGQFENSLFTNFGYSVLRVDTDLGGSSVGTEKLMTNDSPVRGRMTGFCAVGSLFAYAALYNQDTQTGYLVKYGGYGQREGQTTFLDVWHGSLSEPFVGNQVTGLYVSEIGTTVPGHSRTYFALQDGSIGWMINPCVPNPAACIGYRFHVGDGWVDFPIWHGGYHASPKSVRHFSVTGARLDASNYVTIDYKLDPSTVAFTSHPNVFDSATYEISPLPKDATAVLAVFRAHLHNTLATSSPLVSAVSIGHALRPKRYMQVELTILCSDGLVRRDGVPMRIGRRAIQCAVEEAIDTAGAVTCILPDESVQDLSFTDYAIGQSFDEIGRQWRGSLTVKAVQWNTVTTEL